jgi:hypothetical protein
MTNVPASPKTVRVDAKLHAELLAGIAEFDRGEYIVLTPSSTEVDPIVRTMGSTSL